MEHFLWMARKISIIGHETHWSCEYWQCFCKDNVAKNSSSSFDPFIDIPIYDGPMGSCKVIKPVSTGNFSPIFGNYFTYF